jgi:AraC-like DNA-binding protein
MKYWFQKPHPSLAEYVRTILILEGFAQSDENSLPLFTNGMAALFCRMEKRDGGEDIRQLTLFGKSVPECWIVNNNTTIIAYFLKPFALSCLFNIPAVELNANPVDLSAWSPHKMNALRVTLAYTLTTHQKIEALDNLFILQLKEHRRECEIIRYATDEIMNNSGTDVLSILLKKLELNERTFQRMFKKYVGITPSQYRRICQFQLSFTQLRAKKFNTLTDVAFDNGFADQSHFIRSFKEFTEITPTDYLKSGVKRKNE